MCVFPFRTGNFTCPAKVSGSFINDNDAVQHLMLLLKHRKQYKMLHWASVQESEEYRRRN
jgi:hypothetical protein